MNHVCHCPSPEHSPRLVVLTGGPGAGKTAVLEVVRKNFCDHVAVIPEAASIVFGGGFPRRAAEPARCAAQRTIFHVQRELERLVTEERRAAVAICDRGTVDGLAYWPGAPASFFEDVGTTQALEIARYAAVIHLRTPSSELGYNHANPLRVEAAHEAAALDEKILAAWASHPRRAVVESTTDFLEKLARVMSLIRDEVPACCRDHDVPELHAHR